MKLWNTNFLNYHSHCENVKCAHFVSKLEKEKHNTDARTSCRKRCTIIAYVHLEAYFVIKRSFVVKKTTVVLTSFIERKRDFNTTSFNKGRAFIPGYAASRQQLYCNLKRFITILYYYILITMSLEWGITCALQHLVMLTLEPMVSLCNQFIL